MDERQFNAIQNKLNEINNNLVVSHNNISSRQIRLEKILGFQDAALPFEPHYNRGLDISPDYPEIFNKYGEPMEVFFINDRNIAHEPNDKNSRYIIWDRYNYGLKTHFYTDEELFRIVGKPERKFGILLEPRSIKPQCYERVLQSKDYIEKNFDALFTFDAQILSTISNAKFYTCAPVWYGKYSDVVISENNYKRKTKNIAMVCSAKEMCHMHIFRKKLAFRLKAWGKVDTFGKFDGGEFVTHELPFEFYRYSIVVENHVEPYYFTERILNCFAAETIPVYIGATEIGKFFNADGIIQISVDDAEHIEDILVKCTPEEYERRLPAIIENYWRAQQYINFTPFDRIYKEYLKPTR